MYLTNNVRLFVSLFVTLIVTKPKGGFATVGVQRPTRISENIITGRTSIVRFSYEMTINLRIPLRVIFLIIWVLTTGASCTPVPSQAIALTSFTENYVQVSILLEREPAGGYVLSATFTPPDGYHLYSKDIPLTGVNGLGRPTLLELTSASQMETMGELVESVTAQKPDFEPKELLVYPTGPVTLSLPVQLPSGDDWVDDELKITFMACNAVQCKPPAVGKLVSIRVPGANVLNPP